MQQNQVSIEKPIVQSTCVIIPTYNNSNTLGGVIGDVLGFVKNVIVVNDGSTDGTSELLSKTKNIEIVSYAENKGKGYALRKGFEYAISKGFKYAITIDADGQHFAEDIPAFLQMIHDKPDALIIGARNMDQEGVPNTSSFGNKFSSFWFWVETGIKLPDTQSGFRLYPLDKLKNIKWLTNKFEFEIEVPVRLAWHGTEISHVPVKVYYAPKQTRVSHFRPFKDFTRISILNTILVAIAFFYIKPRNFFRKVFSKSIKQHFREQISNPEQTNTKLALSVGLGVFMGIVPLWGYQMVTAVFLAYLLKLNKVIVLLSSNISIPPLIPFILYFSVKTGELISGIHTGISFQSEIGFETIQSLIVVYLIGSVALAAFMSVLLGGLSFLLLFFLRRKSI